MKSDKKLNTSAHDLQTHVSNTRPELEIVRQRAYELYLERGAIDGHEEEDWLRAEAEIATGVRAESTAA